MRTKTSATADPATAFAEHRDNPIFRHTKADGTFMFRSVVRTAMRTYTFKADSLREMQVKIDIALDTP
ncbi:MAG TPA: hypothetical protein VGN12_12800 [Pirellulales bacterium]|jgi:hypothetical protein